MPTIDELREATGKGPKVTPLSDETLEKYAAYNEQIDTQAGQHVVQMEGDYARRLEVLAPVVEFVQALKQTGKMSRHSYPGLAPTFPVLELEPVAAGPRIIVSVRLLHPTWQITIACSLDAEHKIADQTFAQMDGHAAVFTALSKLIGRIRGERQFEHAQKQKLLAEREDRSQERAAARA